MRCLLIFAVFFTGFCHAQNAEFTLRADSTGWTEVCIKGKFNGTIAVQDYRWNKWVGMSYFTLNSTGDTCMVTNIPMHSGMNRLRLQMHPADTTIKWFCSADISVSNGRRLPNNGLKPRYGLEDTIHLPQFSKWEIYDQYGNLMRTGSSWLIPLSGLNGGGYFLNYDNITIEFFIYDVAHK